MVKIALRIGQLSTVVRNTVGEMEVECRFCNAMMWMQEKSSDSSKKEPMFQMCCGKGQYIVERYPATPATITDLLKTNSEFKEHIRSYNSALSFTSMGVQLDNSVNNSIGGAYNFRIHGGIYHRIGSLLPNGNASPCFAQIYIFDAANEITNRLAVAQHVNKDTLMILQQLMHNCNPFVQDFKTMASLARERGLTDLRMVFKAEGAIDRRRYNAPTSDTEIGILIKKSSNKTSINITDVGILIMDGSSNEDEPCRRDIILHLTDTGARIANNGRPLKRISELNQCYDPMHYVLLFPTGHFGWNKDLMNVDRTQEVSAMQYYSFHLMYRKPLDAEMPDVNHHLHLFGTLFQQYIVDMYAKVEQARLNYIRFNQKKLRCDLYQGLQDAVLSGDADLTTFGTKVILPSSFLGGPRHMAQLYQDALSIVRRFGKPDLFVTFTCNPSWPEIKDNLLNGQKACDRPDLCSRVFNLKLKSLMHDIKKEKIFGNVIAHIYTIEYQKVSSQIINISHILIP